MPLYNEVYISQQEFERSLHEKKPYNGFVEKLGYAYTFNFSIPPIHPWLSVVFNYALKTPLGVICNYVESLSAVLKINNGFHFTEESL